MKPKIVIDQDIPFVRGVFEPFATVEYAQGDSFSPEMVRNADALVVRTRTQCDAQLLANSAVKIIATATIGFNHIDTDFCEKNGIFWTNAAGCNAAAVGQYAASALSFLAKKRGDDLTGKTLGIVGVGHVGKEVEKLAKLLKMRILLNDPPRAEKEGKNQFVSLETICHEANFITFHTPLTKDGKFATFHLADQIFFENLQKKPTIINAARGGVVDENCLKWAKKTGKIASIVIDCWENEPKIDLELLNLCDLATPHIAGYSADGKANATQMAVRAVSEFFCFPLQNFTVNLGEKTVFEYKQNSLIDTFLQNYPIQNDSENLKQNPANFEQLRNHYNFRREGKFAQIK